MEKLVPDSRALIERVLRGDARAFGTFVDQHKRLVSHIVFRMVSNRSDREDLCQEVFVKVYNNLGGFQFGSKVSTWVGRIAYNTCINYLQKRREVLLEDMAQADGETEPAIESIAAAGEGADESVVRRDLFERVQAEMEALPPQYRAMLTLYHLDDLTYEEIVEVTGLPMGTVKSYLFRARQILRDRLRRKYRSEDIWQYGT